MHISNIVQQYAQSPQTSELKGTKGIKSLVSSIREMAAGNIFEGTVQSVKNGNVTLSLSNGQTVMARLDGKIPMTIGQSMFFQVKSNDGTQIAIKPFMVDGNNANLTLMDALQAAGLPTDTKNLNMVKSMMEQQMPIDRNSLIQMSRLVTSHPDIDVTTIVQMKNLDIPITPTFASQFENYLDDKQQIHLVLDELMDTLPTLLTEEWIPQEQISDVSGQVIQIVTDGLPEELDLSGYTSEELHILASESGEMPDAQPIETAHQDLTTETMIQEQHVDGNQISEANKEVTFNALTSSADQPNAIPNSLGAVLNKEELQTLNEQLKLFPQMKDVTFLPTDSTVTVLKTVKGLIQASGNESVAPLDLYKLFSGKEFRELLKDAMQQQWTITPQELKEAGNKIDVLYEKMEQQMSRLEKVVESTGQKNEHITQLTSEIRSNVQFMDQINQAYTYVQIPLHMSGQNASGEIYVYTNKKQLQEGTDELTAFLHLDMDHLGSTDVSIRMKSKDVDTKFYFDNDESYNLVANHLDELDERLQKKGYNCKFSLTMEDGTVNFVEDFLKKDQPTTTLHRYSFDMRA